MFVRLIQSCTTLLLVCFAIIGGSCVAHRGDSVGLSPPPPLATLTVFMGKAGGGWASFESEVLDTELVAQFLESNPKEELNALKPYGFDTVSTQVSNVAGGVRLISRGEYSDPMAIIRLVDSSSPFVLDRQKSFSVHWDGETLSLAHSDPRASNKMTNDCTIVRFLTDGFFLTSSCGAIAADGKMIETSVDELSGSKDWLLRLSIHNPGAGAQGVSP